MFYYYFYYYYYYYFYYYYYCRYCAPMAKKIADRAIQVLGGYGYVGEYQVERLWRDAKLLEIGGGTNEAHHKNMFRDLSRNFKKLP